MGKDYYKILGLNRNATEDEIKKAYKKLALKYHPDKIQDKSKSKEAEERFKEVAEAYEVLSDKQKRAIFDQYGSDGLRNGSGGSSGGGGSPNFSNFSYTFHDPRETFSQFFGTDNPFEIFFSMGGGGPGAGKTGSSFFDIDDDPLLDPDPLFASFFGNSRHNGSNNKPFRQSQSFSHSSPRRKMRQDPPVEHELQISLEELLHGCTKRMKISRVVQPSGNREQKVLNLSVKAGWKVIKLWSLTCNSKFFLLLLW